MRQCPKCNRRFLETNARICDVDGAVLDLLVVASERDRLIGTTIQGRYAIDAVLGDGGMGVVYRAVDASTGTRFAVKVLRAEYSAEEDLVIRFEQEAKAAAAIRNAHIVEIYDWGSLPDNSRYFVMEYLDGRSLGDVLARLPKPPGADRRKPLEDELAIHIAMQIADGLGAAHAIGVVHRDIKPDNFHIIRRPDDPCFVKILDFGIAKVHNSKAARTRTGSVFGTPHYMSPEQASGDRNIDAGTDIYGLGVLLYEMLVGKVPFDADNLMGILTAHLYHTPVPPRMFPECERMSPSLEAIILKCLAKTREGRYASMQELSDDLARCRRGDTSEALEDSECRTVRFSRASMPEIGAVLAGGIASGPVEEVVTRPNVRLPEASPPSFAAAGAAPAFGTPASGDPFAMASPAFGHTAGIPSVVVNTHAGVVVARPAARGSALRSWAPLVAAVLGSGAAIGLALFALLGLKSPAPASPAPTRAPMTTVRFPATAPVAPVVGPAPAAPAAPVVPARPVVPAPVIQNMVPVAPHPAQPLSLTVRIETDPPRTTVFRGHHALGGAPLEVARPASGEDTYELASAGYDRTLVRVGATSPSPLRVVLQRHASHGGRHDDAPRQVPAPTSAPPSHPYVPTDLRNPWGN